MSASPCKRCGSSVREDSFACAECGYGNGRVERLPGGGIYQVDEEAGVVTIYAAGIRKEGDKSDVYRVVGRLLSKLGFRGR